jgi:hypothetical protein
VAAWSISLWQSSGQSCISPRIVPLPQMPYAGDAGRFRAAWPALLGVPRPRGVRLGSALRGGSSHHY